MAITRSQVQRRAAGLVLLTALGLAVTVASAQTPPPRDVRQPAVPPKLQPPPVVTEIPPRDRVPQPRVGTGILRGHVVDAVTGRPVARARVRLNGPPRDPVLTDATGVFEFTALPPGNYGLTVDKSTYMSTPYPEMGRTMRPSRQMIAVRNDQAVDDVVVRLFRGGAIAGRVFDAYGDPVDMAQVQVLWLPRNGRPQMRNSASTNDLGEFRVARLQPGRYLLRVSGSVRGFFDPGQPVEKPLPIPVPTYYPSVPSVANAQVIVVNRGETIGGVDITLGEAMPTIVTGLVISADGQPASNASINARLVGSEAFGFDSGGTGVRPDGSFRLTLPPGEYMLEARMMRTGPNMPPNPASEQVGLARVTAAGGTLGGVAIMLGRGATASGRVVFEGSTPPPPSPGQASVPLYNPEGPGCRPVQAVISPDWTFKVEGLNGTCGARPQQMFGRWTLKAVMLRGQDLMDQMVTFEPGQDYGNMQIIVTDRRTQLDLTVTDEAGQPTRDFVALAFSTDKARWAPPSRYVSSYVSMAPPPNATRPPGTVPSRDASAPVVSVLTTMTMSSGVVGGPMTQGAMVSMFNNSFATLPPGEYYFIAVDDMEREDSTDPAIFERLASNATRVAISPDAPVEVTLRRFVFADLIR